MVWPCALILCSRAQWSRRWSACLHGAWLVQSLMPLGVTEHLQQQPSFSLCCGNLAKCLKKGQSPRTSTKTPGNKSSPANFFLLVSVLLKGDWSCLQFGICPCKQHCNDHFKMFMMSSNVEWVTTNRLLTAANGNRMVARSPVSPGRLIAKTSKLWDLS